MIIQQQPMNTDDVMFASDKLLQAGSRVSLRDLYHRETSLSVHRRKFYKTEDVDHLFLLLNGVITDIANQSHKQSQLIKELRAEHDDLTRQLDQMNLISQSNLELSNELKQEREKTSEQAVQLSEMEQLVITQQEKLNRFVRVMKQLQERGIV